MTRERLPTMKERDIMHIESEIEYLGDIRKEIGYFKKLAKNQEFSQEIRDQAADIVRGLILKIYTVKTGIENDQAKTTPF